MKDFFQALTPLSVNSFTVDCNLQILCRHTVYIHGNINCLSTF